MVAQGANSGIYVHGEYEVQVLDSFGKTELGAGDMGAVYGAAPPTVNACKKAGEWQKFVIDFQGGELTGLSGAQPVKAELAVDRGEARTVTVSKLPHGEVWRVAFKLTPAELEQKVNMRLFLTLRGRRVSETWNYLWDPATVPRS